MDFHFFAAYIKLHYITISLRDTKVCDNLNVWQDNE